MRKFALLFTLVFILASCKTITKVEYRDRYVDNYITKVVHDTLREKTSDSTYHEVVTKNDTVYSTLYKEKIRWRDRVVEKIDTFYKDSIQVEYRESVKETKYVPKIYKISMGISILLLIFAIIKLALWLKAKSII